MTAEEYRNYLETDFDEVKDKMKIENGRGKYISYL